MIGSIGLGVRMALYLISGVAAGYGWAAFDPEAGTLTLHLDALAQALGGLLTFVATFVASRWVKRRGGQT